VTTVIALRRPDSGVNAVVFAGDLGQSLAFAILIRAGLVHRRDTSAHKRLMLLATAAIMAPAIVRWPFDFILGGPPFGLVFFYILPPLLLVAYDLATRGHVHRATGLGLGLMTLAVASFLVLPALPGWLAISRWIQRVWPGVTLLVDETALPFVSGASVDDVEALGGSSLQVKNPVATAGCGCGSSFAV